MARDSGFTILPKDSDFHQMSFLYGQPPKVVWLRLGNVTTKRILESILSHTRDLERFANDETAAYLILS